MGTICTATGIVSIAPIISITKATFAADPNPALFPQFALSLVAKASHLVRDCSGAGVAHVLSSCDWIVIGIFAIGRMIAFVPATMNADGIVTHYRLEYVQIGDVGSVVSAEVSSWCGWSYCSKYLSH